MSRPTIENVQDNLITWDHAMYELHREIDKLDQELEIARQRLGDAPQPELSEDSLETIEINIHTGDER
jgi:hypothetical protein